MLFFSNIISGAYRETQKGGLKLKKRAHLEKDIEKRQKYKVSYFITNFSFCFYFAAIAGFLICHLVYVPKDLEWVLWLLAYGLVNKEALPRVPVRAQMLV